jgi:hypothetical protein
LVNARQTRDRHALKNALLKQMVTSDGLARWPIPGILGIKRLPDNNNYQARVL